MNFVVFFGCESEGEEEEEEGEVREAHGTCVRRVRV